MKLSASEKKEANAILQRTSGAVFHFTIDRSPFGDCPITLSIGGSSVYSVPSIDRMYEFETYIHAFVSGWYSAHREIATRALDKLNQIINIHSMERDQKTRG